MEYVRLALGITAAVLHGIAYYLYARQTKLGQSEPNSATWSIWAFLAIANALTYRAMSGDLAGTLQFYVGSVGCLSTFIFTLVIGKFSWPKHWEEWATLAFVFLGCAIWYYFGNAGNASRIVLLAFAISFIPTLDGVIRNPFVETPRSWLIWTIAYVITTVNVTLKPDWQWASILTPAAFLVAHALVAVLSNEGRKTEFYRFINNS